MRSVLRYVVGIVVVYACIFLAVTLYGLIALIPTPPAWWREAPNAVIVGHQLLACLPLSIIAGLTLSKILPGRKLEGSMGCTLGALLLAFGSPPEESMETIASAVFVLGVLLLVFAIGTPATVWLVGRRRASDSRDGAGSGR